MSDSYVQQCVTVTDCHSHGSLETMGIKQAYFEIAYIWCQVYPRRTTLSLISTGIIIFVLLRLFYYFSNYITSRCPGLVKICAALWLMGCFCSSYIASNVVSPSPENNTGIQVLEAVLQAFNRPRLFCSFFVSSLILRSFWDLTPNIVHVVDDSNKVKGSVTKENSNSRDRGSTPPVFPNGWIALLESRSLSTKEMKTVTALGTSYLVYRGEDGKARVMHPYCIHMGEHIESGGKVRGNCVECPFHGWTFDGDNGECIHVPYTTKIPDGIKAVIYESCESNGFVYVWHHAENSPVLWDMPSMLSVNSNRWVFGGRSEHTVFCHIEDIPENVSDLGHFRALHTNSVFAAKFWSRLLSNWEFMTHAYDAEWDTKPTDHTTEFHIHTCISLFGKRIPASGFWFTIKQIGPACVHINFKSRIGEGIVIQSIIPEHPFQHRIIHNIYVSSWFPQFITSGILKGTTTMLERDIEVWNNKIYVKKPIYVKEDKHIRSHRKWYQQFYSENSPTIKNWKKRVGHKGYHRDIDELF